MASQNSFTLRLAIAAAVKEKAVESGLLEESALEKARAMLPVLVIQPLRMAMERGEVIEIKSAIMVAEGEAEADPAVIKVSEATNEYV